MFGFFGKSPNAPPWLGDNEKLFALKWKQANLSLDPQVLWDARYGGGGRDSGGLREALDRHRCLRFENDERGWLKETRKVFTDVILWIPPAIWRQEIQVGAARIERLVDNLAKHHEEDFGDDLAFDRRPAYAVMPNPDPDSPEDELVFQFGLGVFVPLPTDRRVERVELKIQDRTPWRALPDFTFWKGGKPTRRPMALYENQQFLLLGASLEDAAIQAPPAENDRQVWFSHNRGSAWFNLGLGERDGCFGDDRCVSDGRFVHRDPETGGREFLFRDALRGPEEAGENLMIRFVPVKEAEDGAADGPSALRHSLRPGGNVIHSLRQGLTIVPGMIRHRLSVSAIALPRAEGIAGLESWTLWFRPSGDPANEDESPEGFAGFSATSAEKRLRCRMPGQTDFGEVPPPPATLAAENGLSFEIAPSPIPEMHHGILGLPVPRFHPVGENPFLIGRNVPESDFRLDILAQPGSLAWAPGRGRVGATLGDIGLSGEHFRVRLEGDRLAVKMTRGRLPVHVLDRAIALEETLMPFQEKEALLSPGQYLLVGCYMLGFDV
jgi:hypothetical protein